MTYEIKITSAARDDLQDIYDYIAIEKQSPINAENLIKKIKSVILELNFLPKSYRIYDKEPFKDKNIRFVPVGNYIIFYATDDKLKIVNIVRILYGKMDFSKISK